MITESSFFRHYFYQLRSCLAASKFALNSMHALENLYGLRLFFRGLSRGIEGPRLFNCNNCLVNTSCIIGVDQRFYFFYNMTTVF